MSYRVVQWVMEQSVPDNACKLLLMVIGTHSDDAGRCYPRIALLAREASMSPRTAHRVLARLEVNYTNLIGWERRDGASNVYQFRCPDFSKRNVKTLAAATGTTVIEVAQPSKTGSLAHLALPAVGGPKNHHLNHHNQGGRDLSKLPRARGLPNKDRGAIELSLAQKLGPTLGDGIELLSSLPPGEIDLLCALERRGRINRLDLERARELVRQANIKAKHTGGES
jgi:hypothetical protein